MAIVVTRNRDGISNGGRDNHISNGKSSSDGETMHDIGRLEATIPKVYGA